MRDEPLVEGGDFRYFYTLKLHFDRLIVFPAALTLRHVIDKSSPLYRATPESLETTRALFFVSVSGIDPIIAAAVQAQQDYSWRDVALASASSKSTPSQATDSSRWITVAFTTPKLRSKFASLQNPLFNSRNGRRLNSASQSPNFAISAGDKVVGRR